MFDSLGPLIDFCWDMSARWLCFANEMNFLAQTGHKLPKSNNE